METTNAFRNKFSGECCKTGVPVAAGLGYITPRLDGGWDVWSEEAYSKNGPKARKKNVGVTLKKSVRDTWVHVFEQNERAAAAGEMPMTDLQISEFMKAEFPLTSSASKNVKRVRMYRGCYNKGSHSFKGLGEPEIESNEYNSRGEQVSGGRSSGMNESRMRELIREELGDRPAINIIFKKGKKTKTKTISSGTHKCFAKIMKKIEAGLPVLLVGPAGSGKTTLASQIATALEIDFTFNSMSEGVSESSLLGRILPDSKKGSRYIPAPFVNTYRNGGVHLFDEVDAADPNLMVIVNAAIANGQLSIPFAGEVIEKHADTVLIAAANTFGRGADRQYVGRNQLDAATLDRFAISTVTVDYDRDLERELVDAILKGSPAEKFGTALLNWAWAIRDRITENKMRRLMSTRAIVDMSKCLVTDDSLESIKRDFFEGWQRDEIARVQIGGAF